MAATHDTASRTLDTTRTTARTTTTWSRRERRNLLVAVLSAALAGALAFGIFLALQGGEAAISDPLQRAEADAAHLNARAAAYSAREPSTVGAGSTEALEAYGARWSAQSGFAPSSSAADSVSAAASAAAIDAYADRWSVLAERFVVPEVSESALRAYGERWTALGARYEAS